ncbi:MAG: DUF4214 domain-containing protein [Pirellulales bacterium]|nr:DUF4214 domain-containing protein [Pirellulales bacterium]
MNGAFDLTVNTTGATTFGGVVGGNTALTSLTTNAGGATSLAGNVTTTGTQTYNDAVTLTGSAILASTGNAAITLASTVNGAFDLTVNTTGATTFGGVVGGTSALTSLTTNAGGTTSLAGNVTTTGAQTYNDAVTLTGSAILASTGNAAITLASTVNGAFDLTVNTTGATTFGGVVGGNTALTSLTTNAGGATSLAGNVTTTGAQTYNDAVTLTGSAILASTGNAAITLASTVNGAFDLTVNTTGATTFGGVVGGTSALTSLTTNAGGTTSLAGNVTTTGAQTYNDAVTLAANITLAGTNVTFGSTLNSDGTPRSLTVNASGATTFGGVVGGTNALASLTTNAAGSTTLNANVTTTGAQTYNDPVTLTGNVVLNGVGVTFASTINSDATPRALTINDSAVTTLGGAIGGTNALASLTTNAGGVTRIAADITTTGGQNYNDPVTLIGDAVLSSTAAADVLFAATVNSDATARSLRVNTAGTTIFATTVGGTNPLASLTTDAGGTTRLGGNVTTAEGQTYGDDVRLDADVTLTSNNAGSIALLERVDSAAFTHQALVINTSGSTEFGDGGADYVGSQDALTSLVTNDGAGDDDTRFQMLDTVQPTVRTTGAQTFGDHVLLRSDVRLRSEGQGTIAFREKVDSFTGTNFALNVETGGFTDFGDGGADYVGSVQPLLRLVTDDFAGAVATDRTRVNIVTDVVLGPASITTVLDQVYGDPVELLAATWLKSVSGNLDLRAGVTGPAFVLRAEAQGNVRYAAVVDVAAGSQTLAATVTIDGESAVEGAPVLLDDTLRLFFDGASSQPAFRLNGAGPMQVPGLGGAVATTRRFTFNAGAGDDRLIVQLDDQNRPVPKPFSDLTTGIVFHGGETDEDGPGDLLQVFGVGAANNEVQYRPDALVTGAGLLRVGPVGPDAGRIVFDELEPVDLAELAVVTITLPNANNVVQIADGDSFGQAYGDPAQKTLVVSGTSGAVAFESAALWNNASVNVDTDGGAVVTVDNRFVPTAGNPATDHGNGLLRVVTGSGADTVNVQAIRLPTTILSGTGADTINVSDSAPALSGTLNLILANLSIDGSAGDGATDVLHVSDLGDGTDNTGIVTESAISGLGMSSLLTYLNVDQLDLQLGTGYDTLALLGTSAATEIRAGGGNDTINVGSIVPPVPNAAPSVFAGTIKLFGGDQTDQLNVIQNDGYVPKLLTSNTVEGTGLPVGGVGYAEFEGLLVQLSTQDDTFTIASTNALTPVTLRSLAGADSIEVLSISSATTIQTGADADRVVVGEASASPHLDLLENIGAMLSIDGGPPASPGDELVISDKDDALANTGVKAGLLTASQLTGLGLAATLTYANFEQVSLLLGTQTDELTIDSTNATTATKVFGNGGDDQLTVRATAGPTTVLGGQGGDVIRVASTTNTLNQIAGGLVVGAGPLGENDRLTFDDSGDPAAGATAQMTSQSLGGLGSAVPIVYGGAEGVFRHVEVLLGAGANTIFNLELPLPAGSPSAQTPLPAEMVIDAAAGDNELLRVLGTNFNDTLLVGPLAAGNQLDARNFECLHMFGFSGNDRFENGTATPSFLVGGQGSDTLSGGSANDFILGDGVAISDANPARDLLSGNNGADVIFGGPDVDSLLGGDGTDFLFPDYDVLGNPPVTVETIANGDVLDGGGDDGDPDSAVSLGNGDVLGFIDGLFVDTGAIKDVFTWLRGRFLRTDPANIQVILDAANAVPTCKDFASLPPVANPSDADSIPVADNPIVAQSYLRFLRRPADDFGLESWSRAVAINGLSIEGMRAALIGSPEYFALPQVAGNNTNFVNLLYQDVLGRAPSAAELQNALNQIGAGTARSQIALTLLVSTEARVYEINAIVFAATPPAPGLAELERNAMLADLNQSVPFDVVVQGYQQARLAGANYSDNGRSAMSTFVHKVFVTLMDRPTGPVLGELAISLANLAAGQTKDALVAIFQGSDEYRIKLLDRFYQRYLGRPLDALGQAVWLTALKNGTRVDQVQFAILGSPEYFAKNGGTNTGFINALYHDLLNHDSTPGAVNYFLGLLAQPGLTREYIAYLFISDKVIGVEYQARLMDELYLDHLGRTATDAEKIAGVQLLQQRAPFEQVERQVVLSPGYLQ